MLPKKNRISRALFGTVLTHGTSFHSAHLSFRSFCLVRQTAQGQSDTSKFSFVVSKKVSKSAVKRNMLRRRGYTVLTTILSNKLKEKMKGSVLGIFFFKKGAEKMSFSEIHDEIVFLLKKARIL